MLHTILAGLFKYVYIDQSFVRLCPQSKELLAASRNDVTVCLRLHRCVLTEN